MKLILRADVENLGKLGDVVSVKAGYGRNYLLPQGIAMQATPGNLKAFELERKKLQARMDALRAEANGLAGHIEALGGLLVAMRVGENDKLYGSVTTAILAKLLAEKGIEIDRRRILMDAPIRTLGEYEIRIRLHADVIAPVAVKVVAEDKHHEDAGAPHAEKPEQSAKQETAAE